VQRLMAENGQNKHDPTATIQDVYVLSHGILHCGRCGGVMEGRSGTGRLGTKYFYYACRNKECNLKIAADEIETAVLERIQQIASDGPILQLLTKETNVRLLKQKPELERQKQVLEKSLNDVKNQADKLIDLWTNSDEKGSNSFIKEKLNNLAQRRTELENGMVEIDQALQQIQEKALDAGVVRNALSRIDEVIASLNPSNSEN
jgi:hypothetical protein